MTITGFKAVGESPALFLLEFITALYLALIIREFSRLVACKIIGWDTYLLRIWPFLVRFRPFAIRLEGIPGKHAAGSVLAFPPTPEKQTVWRTRIFNFSGATINFICAAACLVVFTSSPLRSVGAGVIFAIASLFVAILSFQTLQKAGPCSPFGIAYLRALALCTSGVLPGQFDSALVNMLEAGESDGALENDVATLRSADIFLYEHYVDLENYDKAREALDRAISRTQPSDRMWDGLCIENAFFSAFIERNLPLAEESLAKVRGAKLNRSYPYRQALAAIAIARGNGGEALRLLRPTYQNKYSLSGGFQRHVHASVIRAADKLVSIG